MKNNIENLKNNCKEPLLYEEKKDLLNIQIESKKEELSLLIEKNEKEIKDINYLIETGLIIENKINKFYKG